MPKSKGIQVWPGGEKFPAGLETGGEQRLMNPGKMPKGKGEQVFDAGHRFGKAGTNDSLIPHTPGSVPSKGPQTQASIRTGTIRVEDSSRPMNPKK